MTQGYLLVAFGYAALVFAVIQFERRRTRGKGIDVTTIFMVLSLLQSCIPGIAIYALLPFVDRAAPTAKHGSLPIHSTPCVSSATG